MKTKRGFEIIETASHVPTFNTPNLPTKIDIAIHKRIEVRPYIPPPLKCFRCMRFGHLAMRCTNDEVCVCGKPKHIGTACNSPYECLNCGGEHLADDKRCPKYILEKTTQKIKIMENIPYREAKKKATINTPSQGVTYSNILRTKFVEEKDLLTKIIPELTNEIESMIKQYISIPTTHSNTSQSTSSSENLETRSIEQNEIEDISKVTMLPPRLTLDTTKSYSKRKGDERSPPGDDADESESSQGSQKSKGTTGRRRGGRNKKPKSEDEYGFKTSDKNS